MSRADFRVFDANGADAPVAHRYIVKAGAATSIKAGEWVIRNTSGDAEYALIAANGASNSDTWIGVAATDSTDTASVDGEVYVYDNPNYWFAGKATTFANVADSILLSEVTLDVAASVMTIDEDDTSNGTLRIMGYNSTGQEIYVKMAGPDHISGK